MKRIILLAATIMAFTAMNVYKDTTLRQADLPKQLIGTWQYINTIHTRENKIDTAYTVVGKKDKEGKFYQARRDSVVRMTNQELVLYQQADYTKVLVRVNK